MCCFLKEKSLLSTKAKHHFFVWYLLWAFFLAFDKFIGQIHSLRVLKPLMFSGAENQPGSAACSFGAGPHL